MYEVVPPFYRELDKLHYFNEFYLATDKKDPYGLGANVHIVQLDKDLGWEGNLTRLLEEVPEELFVFMCDDHVLVRQHQIDLDRLFDIMRRNPGLGRLQLSPPSLNYARFLQAHRMPTEIPDDSKEWYRYDKRYRFHLNFQPSIWRKDFCEKR